MTLLDSFARAVVRRRAAVLAGCVLATALLAIPLSWLRVGYSVQSFLRNDSELLRELAAHYDEFEVPDNLLLLCYPEDDPWSMEAQERLEELDRDLRALDGVERVVTLASAPGLGRGYGQWLRERVLASHTWRRLLVSEREDALGGVLVLEREDSVDRSALLEDIRTLARAHGVDLALAGEPYHREAVLAAVRDDQALFLPLGGLILTVLLLWFLPSPRLALLTLSVVPFTLVATLGSMALLGVELTLLTSALPIVLMCMAVAGAVHLVGRFVEERRTGSTPEAAAERTLTRLLLPCFLTALTTAIGFLSLTLATLPDLRDLGAFAALGVGWAWLFTVLVLPAALSCLRSGLGRTRVDLPTRMARLAARTGGVPPARVLVPALMLLLGAVWLAAGVEQNARFKGDFWPGSTVARETAFYEERFVSMVPSEVLATAEEGFGAPDVRAQLGRLVDWLEGLETVDRTLSIEDLLRDGVPMLLVRGMGSVAGLLSRDGQTARVLVFQANAGNRYLTRFREMVDRQDELLPDLRVRVAGLQVVAGTLIDRLTGTLARSFVGSLCVILIVVALHFRSLRLGSIAIAPNVLSLLLTLAFMGLADLQLRPLSVISFCIAFGLAVDNTIHLLARYREERGKGRGAADAVAIMLATAGRPVVVTTLLLLVGFLVILTSSFRGTFEFGLLVSLALAGAALGALLLLPALLNATRGFEGARAAASASGEPDEPGEPRAAAEHPS